MRPIQRIRVLLVEDHAELADATEEFLETMGLDVRLAEDGKSALEVAEAFRPQIVLCDLRLSDISGLEVARALRSNPHTRDIVFALYSALAESDLRALQSDYSDHIDCFLSKPLTEKMLKKLLGELKRK